MSNTNFVCFYCRTVRRYPNWTSGHRCQFCAKPLSFSYYKFRIPEKRDAKGWEGLRLRVRAYNDDVRKWKVEQYREKIGQLRSALASVHRRNVKRITVLEERILENERNLNRWIDWR